MKLPPGYKKYTAIAIPTSGISGGALPFNQPLPDPFVDHSPTTVFAPAGQLDRTALLDGEGKRVITFTPTLDGRSLAHQIGPYASVISQTDGQQLISVVYPVEIASFIKRNPVLESAVSLLDAFLSRESSWSKEGYRLCSQILRAIARVITSYQLAFQSAGTLSVDLMIYLGILKNLFSGAALFFGGRVQEAAGTQVPLLLKSSQDLLTLILKGTSLSKQGVLVQLYDLDQSIYTTVAGLVDVQLTILTRGVLIL